MMFTKEIQEFRRSSTYVRDLAQLLENPTLKEALERLDTLCRPRSMPSPMPGVAHDTTIAHAYCECMGVTKAIRALKAMAVAVEDGEINEDGEIEEEPFVANLPPEFRSRPKNLK